MGQRSSTTSLSTEQPSTTTTNQTNAGNNVNQSNSNSTSSVQSRNSNSRNNRNIITQSNSTQNVSNMSPRSRFRHEMTRRGYTNSSSDIFLRLFQIPTSSSTSSSSNQQNNQSGLSSFRIFNLRNNPNSNQDLNDLDSDLSSDEDESNWNHNLNSLAHSLPFFFGMRDLKCFVCNKMIPADDVEAHIMMCLTKPRLTYNEDVLTDDKGECIICLENLEKGQTIARLTCLCIYHKQCIDEWLSRSQSCPGHPPD